MTDQYILFITSGLGITISTLITFWRGLHGKL